MTTCSAEEAELSDPSPHHKPTQPRMDTTNNEEEVALPMNYEQEDALDACQGHFLSGLLPGDILLGSHQRISGGERRGWYGIGRALVRREESRGKRGDLGFPEVKC